MRGVRKEVDSINGEEVTKGLKKMESRKSASLDEIAVSFLRQDIIYLMFV